jgi:hypothetical protein
MFDFPAICVDNFYNDPDRVREWALSLEYKPPPAGQWPGKRSEKLHLVDPVFFDNFCKKVFSLFFDLEKTDIDWNIHTQFQIISPFDDDPKSMKNSGWIHFDDTKNIFGGLIYLTPDIDLRCGTSIFRQDRETGIKNAKEAKEIFYSTGFYENYDEILKKFNSAFTETVTFQNVYNRFIAFDSYTAHKANNFFSNIPRLTQVFFVEKCETNSSWPLHRHRRYL